MVLLLSLLTIGAGAWRRGLLFLLVALAGTAVGGLDIYRQQAARIELAARQTTPLFKLMSFNILGTNLENGSRIADAIGNSGADIAVVLEAEPVVPYLDRLAATYPYRLRCDPGKWCDTLLLSRTPLETTDVRSLGPLSPNRLMIVSTTIGGSRVTIAAAHLSKPYFDNIASGETEALVGVLKSIDGPLVLAGDFNAPAWTSDVAGLARRAGLVPGPGYPATWPVGLGPLGVPIDNVFTRAPLLVTSVEAMPDPMGSNHRGLVADIALTTE